MRPPDDVELPAPEFPPELEWLNVPFVRMDKLLGSGAALVEFWDFARVNSLRTLPYLQAWHERYASAGLRVVGVHSPGYSCSRDRDAAAAAVERLEIGYPVLLDPGLELWRAYGNRGWPGRYLFDRRGLLRDVHYGEGDYQAAELAIQEVLREIDADLELPAPLDTRRSESRSPASSSTRSPRSTLSTRSSTGSRASASPPATSSASCGASADCGSTTRRASWLPCRRWGGGLPTTCPSHPRRPSCTATFAWAT